MCKTILGTLYACLTKFILIVLIACSPFVQAAPQNVQKSTPTGLLITAEVSGISGEVLENVSARLKMNLRPASEQTTLADIKNFYQKAPEEIRDALKPFGFFYPKITSQLSHEGNLWKASFNVEPGNAIEISAAQIEITGEGATDEKFQKLKDTLLIKLGRFLNVKLYEDAKQDLYELAEKRGYFQAKVVDSQMEINLDHYTATLYIHFDTGPRFHFGAVTFSPSPLADRFLQRFKSFKPGDPYSESKVEKLQQDLSSSNYFQKVLVEHKVGPNQEALINVKLKAKKARQYLIGVGWSSNTRARGLFSINFRRLNPYGHQFKIDTEIAQLKQVGRAVYTIPGKKPATDQYRISGAVEKLNENPGYALNKNLQISYVTAFKKWYPTFSMTLLDEKFTLKNEIPPNFPLYRPEKSDTMLIPSFNLIRSKSDDPLKPTQGYQINFTLRGASHSVLAKHSFLQSRLDLKGLYSLNESNRIIVRGALARTKIDSIYNLPLSLQYFAGGTHTMRGYHYLEIGPGKAFMFASAEFQHRIKNNLFLAVFYDMGNVSQHFFKDIKRSPGVGLVYVSPIGDISFDVATALDNTGYSKKGRVRFQFNMGANIFSTSSKE